jgi:uncharacterized protein DUF4238
MEKKDKQHIIPKTFLKRFEISNYKSPNHVWCLNFEDEYNKKPLAKGISNKVFIIKNFYSLHEIENKYFLENFFAQKIEPSFDLIFSKISEEKEIDESIRLKIIEWIFYTNQRTDYIRGQIKGTYEKMSEFMARFDAKQKGIEFSKETFDKEIQSESKRVARRVQIGSMLNNENFEKLFSTYYDNLINKSWTILKSNPDNPFIANDNPGFSINTTGLFSQKPFHPTIHLNHPAFNYLVISPKYCLYMGSFKEDVPIEINAFNMEIEFKEVSNNWIDYINCGTFYTSKKYLISNRYDSLEKWIQNKTK